MSEKNKVLRSIDMHIPSWTDEEQLWTIRISSYFLDKFNENEVNLSDRVKGFFVGLHESVIHNEELHWILSPADIKYIRTVLDNNTIEYNEAAAYFGGKVRGFAETITVINSDLVKNTRYKDLRGLREVINNLKQEHFDNLGTLRETFVNMCKSLPQDSNAWMTINAMSLFFIDEEDFEQLDENLYPRIDDNVLREVASVIDAELLFWDRYKDRIGTDELNKGQRKTLTALGNLLKATAKIGWGNFLCGVSDDE